MCVFFTLFRSLFLFETEITESIQTSQVRCRIKTFLENFVIFFLFLPFFYFPFYSKSLIKIVHSIGIKIKSWKIKKKKQVKPFIFNHLCDVIAISFFYFELQSKSSVCNWMYIIFILISFNSYNFYFSNLKKKERKTKNK